MYIPSINERNYRDAMKQLQREDAAKIADHRLQGNCCRDCIHSHKPQYTTFCKMKSSKTVNPFSICQHYKLRG